MKFRLYYGNGTTYDGETDSDAYAAPTMDVVILKLEDKTPSNWRGFTLRHGAVFLCWERIHLSDGTILAESRWAGKDDLVGLTDYWSYHQGPQKVLPGREIHDQTYKELCTIAARDGCLCGVPCDHKAE